LRSEQQRSRSHLWQIAAALLIFAVLGGLTWSAHERARKFDDVIMREAALEKVEETEKQHIAAINNLEKMAKPALSDPSSPLLVSYREKLMLLDDAIAECQANIDRNRQNAHLRRQLLAIYSEKQRTLQEVLREESHASNQ
jgi:hypothetical protein